MDAVINILGIGLGHPRFLHTDLNLLIQIIALIVLIVGLFYKNKGKIKLHGISMGIATVLHTLSFVLVMGPSLYQSLDFLATETYILGVQTLWFHAIPGTVALLLGIFLVAKWAIQASNINACYKRKRIMDVTLLIWLFSLAFGIATYVLFYL